MQNRGFQVGHQIVYHVDNEKPHKIQTIHLMQEIGVMLNITDTGKNR